MSELTKEYFDQENKITREQISKLEEKTKNFVTKEYFDRKSEEFLTFSQFGAQMGIQNLSINGRIRKVADEFRKHVDESQAELAAMVGEGFVDVISRLNLKDRVTRLEEHVGIHTN